MNILKGGRTGIWHNKTFYPANEEGSVIIPYRNGDTKTSKIILVHNEFADIIDFTHKPEKYKLICRGYLSHETLSSNKARMLF